MSEQPRCFFCNKIVKEEFFVIIRSGVPRTVCHACNIRKSYMKPLDAFFDESKRVYCDDIKVPKKPRGPAFTPK